LSALSLTAPAAPGVEPQFFSFPYPNDLRLDADGTPALAGFPREPGLVGSYVDIVDAHVIGFGPTQAAYFRFDGELDVSTLPDPAGTIAASASVFLVDVTPGSPHRGEKLPLQIEYQDAADDFLGAHSLALRPYPGIPPREGAVYAAVVTDGVHGRGAMNGKVVAADALRRVLDGAAGSDLEKSAATAYAPLVSWLDEQGLRAHVAAATVYTTNQGTSIMDALRTAVYTTPAPTLGPVVHVGTMGNFDLYTSSYDAPNFQIGTSPYTTTGGQINLGADGKPAPTHTENLRTAFSVPEGAMPSAGWPVILYAHGTGGDYETFVDDGTAGRFADVTNADGSDLARFVVISIDQVLAGTRSPPGTDQDTAFFNFDNILAARDNIKQGALDDFQLLRLVGSINLPTLPDGSTPFKLDTSHIYFFGHSEGSLTGSLFVGAEPRVSAAIFSGCGAGLVSALLLKTQPVNIAGLVQDLFDDPVDDFNPMLNLLQGFFDESDPENYARRFFAEPPSGQAPKSVYVSLGLRDEYAPDPTIAIFALAAGVAPVSPDLAAPGLDDGLALAGGGFVNAPQAKNVAGGAATGVLCEYDPGVDDADDDFDGHFVIFNVPAAEAQSTRFLGTHVKAGVATLVPAN
jgi:hypothetical protein